MPTEIKFCNLRLNMLLKHVPPFNQEHLKLNVLYLCPIIIFFVGVRILRLSIIPKYQKNLPLWLINNLPEKL